MYNTILEQASKIKTPGFFITVECSKETDKMPEAIEDFIFAKLELIKQGTSARKFVYQQDGWRLIFTFFPTNEVVDERYALKNKVYKRL
ncbi:hypothetical protein [Bacteroides sp. 519]|uniref:hypothetical protein n=1 Tax=Bacteroides sp. 519 TaxID=2302937 RepID=UPI0013D404CD|nr:hypothetical protein [Bacteroides sp. 519]NDV59538.1 hypothetical protein [Bacteroides sp. 519]